MASNHVHLRALTFFCNAVHDAATKNHKHPIHSSSFFDRVCDVREDIEAKDMPEQAAAKRLEEILLCALKEAVQRDNPPSYFEVALGLARELPSPLLDKWFADQQRRLQTGLGKRDDPPDCPVSMWGDILASEITRYKMTTS